MVVGTCADFAKVGAMQNLKIKNQAVVCVFLLSHDSGLSFYYYLAAAMLTVGRYYK